MLGTDAVLSLHELTRRVIATRDRDIARRLAERTLAMGQPPATAAEFIDLLPGVPGRLTPDLFDVLCDAFDFARGDQELSDPSVVAPPHKETA